MVPILQVVGQEGQDEGRRASDGRGDGVRLAFEEAFVFLQVGHQSVNGR